MADFYGTSRSNYFRVKDKEAFSDLCNSLNVEMIENDDLVGFICNQDEYGYLPSSIYNEKTDEDEEIDFVIKVSEHLLEDEVAVFMTAGAEKHRYVQGIAIAVNSKGEIIQLDMNDIYKKAEKLGKNITHAEY